METFYMGAQMSSTSSTCARASTSAQALRPEEPRLHATDARGRRQTCARTQTAWLSFCSCSVWRSVRANPSTSSVTRSSGDAWMSQSRLTRSRRTARIGCRRPSCARVSGYTGRHGDKHRSSRSRRLYGILWTLFFGLCGA